MGRLTDDMTRLVAEINTGHSERSRLIPEGKHSNSQMMNRFHATHTQMAREQRQSLQRFTSTLRQTVAGLRMVFAADIAGARAVFFGGAAAVSVRGRGRRAAV